MQTPAVYLTDLDGRRFRLSCHRVDKFSVAYFLVLSDTAARGSVVIGDSCFSVLLDSDFLTVNVGMSFVTFPVSEMSNIEKFKSDVDRFLVAA